MKFLTLEKLNENLREFFANIINPKLSAINTEVASVKLKAENATALASNMKVFKNKVAEAGTFIENTSADKPEGYNYVGYIYLEPNTFETAAERDEFIAAQEEYIPSVNFSFADANSGNFANVAKAIFTSREDTELGVYISDLAVEIYSKTIPTNDIQISSVILFK